MSSLNYKESDKLCCFHVQLFLWFPKQKGCHLRHSSDKLFIQCWSVISKFEEIKLTGQFLSDRRYHRVWFTAQCEENESYLFQRKISLHFCKRSFEQTLLTVQWSTLTWRQFVQNKNFQRIEDLEGAGYLWFPNWSSNLLLLQV